MESGFPTRFPAHSVSSSPWHVPTSPRPRAPRDLRTGGGEPGDPYVRVAVNKKRQETIMTPQQRLIAFAERVLDLLAAYEEWDSDTLDEIGSASHDLKLSTTDPDGFFARLPSPNKK